MQREAMVAAIEAIYSARCKGDLAAMAPHFAEGATYEFAGDPTLLPGFPAPGASPALQAIEGLIDAIAFHQVHLETIVTEGNRAAVLMRATVEFRGNPPFETRLYDLIEFDAQHRVTSLLQFADTAKVVAEVAMLAARIT